MPSPCHWHHLAMDAITLPYHMCCHNRHYLACIYLWLCHVCQWWWSWPANGWMGGGWHGCAWMGYMQSTVGRAEPQRNQGGPVTRPQLPAASPGHSRRNRMDRFGPARLFRSLSLPLPTLVLSLAWPLACPLQLYHPCHARCALSVAPRHDPSRSLSSLSTMAVLSNFARPHRLGSPILLL